MKTIISRFIMLLLLLAGVANSGWGDTTITIQSSTDVGTGTAASGENSITKDGITISCTAGGFAISGGAHYRLASGSTTTISSTIGNIKSIVITGPSGTDSYSISKFGTNSGWTLNSSKGTYTWTGSATPVTVVANSGQVRPTKFEITCEGSSLTTPTFTWSATGDMNLTVGGSKEARTATASSGGTVTYSSSDEAVATVNASTGEVSPVGEGTCTITASVVATGSYSSGSSSYTVNVAAATVTGYYQLVESDPGADNWGGTYLIVYTDGSRAMNGGLGDGMDAANNYIDVTITSKKIPISSATNAASFTIAGNSTDGYTIKSASGYYIGCTSNSNELDVNLATAYANSISFNDGDVDIVGSGGPYLRYNASSGQERFRYFKTTTYTNMEAIQLYKKVVTSGGPATGSFSFGTKSITKQVGNTWHVNYSGTNSGNFTFTSSDETVAQITNSSNGSVDNVKALKVGTARITCNVAASDFYTACSDYYDVTVTKGASDLTLTSAATVAATTEMTSTTITYTTSSTGAISFSSDNTSVATVAQGTGNTLVVTLKSVAGTAHITFSQAADDNYNASSVITVTINVTEPSTTESGTGTIVFSTATEDNGHMRLNDASDSGKDSNGYTWNVTTVGTTSFNPNSSYCQVGSSSYPATSITFTMTLPSSCTITSFSAKFGGFTGTAGTVTLKVGSETVKTGSLSATSDVTVSSGTISKTGSVLTVTVTGISKGVKAYNITYAYEDLATGGGSSFNSGYYYRLSGGEIPEDDYLIVYEASYHDPDEFIYSNLTITPRAMDGSTTPTSASGNLVGPYVEVSIANDRIPATLDNAMYHISGSGDEVQVMSKARSMYIGDNGASESDKNFLQETSTVNTFYNTASIDQGFFNLMGSANNAKGVGGATVPRYLRYNAQNFPGNEENPTASSTDGKMFRFYRLDNYVMTKLSLYRRVNSDEKYVQFVPHRATIGVDETFVTQIVTQNTTGTPTYSSPNEEVATIDEDGVITAHSAGQVDLQVTVDGVTNYFNLTVTSPQVLSRYIKVAATTDLTEGEYLIVSEKSGGAKAYVMDGSLTINDDVAVSEMSEEATIETDKDTENYSGKKVIGATSTIDESKFTFYVRNSKHYVQSNSGYYIGKTTESDGISARTGAIYGNTLSADATNATFQGSAAVYLKYNGSGFQFYTSGQTDIQLYKKVYYNYKLYSGESTPRLTPLAAIEGPVEMGNNEIAVYDISTEVAADHALMDNIQYEPNVAVNGTAYHLKISDKVDGVYTPFYAPAALTIATNLTYSRGNAGGWNSVCLPISIPFEKVEDMFGSGVEVWRLKGLDDNAQVEFVQLKSGETVPAGEPVLVNSDVTAWDIQKLAGPFDVNGVQGGEVTKAEKSSAIGTVALIGTYTQIVPGEVAGSELFKLTGDGTCFGKLSKTGKVFPFRMYLKFTPAEGMAVPAQLSLSLLEDDGDWTGIVVPKAKSDERWYDLSGRAVDYPISKGIYVRNGRKVVVK